MKHSSKLKDGILFIQLQGDLIGEENGAAIVDLANDKINEGVLQSAIDLSGVRYMNSSGIGVLITVLTKFRNKGGEIVLVNPSDQIKKLLIITKLNAIFNIVENESEAVAKLKK